MYAKLVFPIGTDYTKICRDIARCIDNSDGAGGSTVGALEFVTAADSSIDDTVAASWSLSSGQTIATGNTNVEQDKNFYFQETHANTSTKYVAIRTVFVDTSGFTKANDSNWSSVAVFPVCDKGESYEFIPGTPNPSASVGVGTAFSYGVTGPVIHVIARAGTIFIAGEGRQGATTAGSNIYFGQAYTMVTEPAQQREHVEGRNRPAQVWFMGRAYNNNTTGGESVNSVSEFYNYTSTNIWSLSERMLQYVCFVDSAYDYENNFELRVCGSMCTRGTIGASAPPGSTGTDIISNFIITRDTAEASGNKYASYQNLLVYKTMANANTAVPFDHNRFAYGAASQGFSGVLDTSGYNFRLPHLFTHMNLIQSKNLAGNDVIKMLPLVRTYGRTCAVYDLTEAANCYVGSANFQGVMNNSISDGTDTYLGVKVYDTNNTVSPVAFIIKK